jgi:single-strand DNA-binding protein
MNKVILMGRLTRDPELRYSNKGEEQTAICNYTLAVDRRQRNQDGSTPADFIPCTAFGRAAEFAEKYFTQGLRVLVTGRIQTGSYTNRDGVKVYTTTVIIEEQEFADSKKDGGAADRQRNQSEDRRGGSGYRDDQGKYHDGYGSYDSTKEQEGFMNIPDGAEDEGLPFN